MILFSLLVLLMANLYFYLQLIVQKLHGICMINDYMHTSVFCLEL